MNKEIKPVPKTRWVNGCSVEKPQSPLFVGVTGFQSVAGLERISFSRLSVSQYHIVKRTRMS